MIVLFERIDNATLLLRVFDLSLMQVKRIGFREEAQEMLRQVTLNTRNHECAKISTLVIKRLPRDQLKHRHYIK